MEPGRERETGEELTFNAFIRDITERKLREERVTFLAYHDQLTGLPNRTMFEHHLDLVLARAAHDGTAAALLYLDVDKFKHVNDTFGHDAGAELLRRSPAGCGRPRARPTWSSAWAATSS